MKVSDAQIAIVSPYPASERFMDGWMSRIKTVDTLLGAKKRIYIDFQEWYPDNAEPESIVDTEIVKGFRVSPKSPQHLDFVLGIFETVPFTYIHTMHQCEYILDFFNPKKMLVDIHGIVPEEELMLGSPERSEKFSKIEAQILSKAHHLAVVTQSMAEHLRYKYPDSSSKLIHFPVVDFAVLGQDRDLIFRKNDAVRRELSNATAVYAGGAQTWQCVDLMLDAIRDSRHPVDARIYSHDTDNFKEKLRNRGLEDNVFGGYISKEHLALIYHMSNYGFVLRQDSAVNRVASPTKICDYLAAGVIPIVDFVNIGDFTRYGYHYILVKDFIDGNIPDSATQRWMNASNRKCLDFMYEEFQDGWRAIQSLFPSH